MATFDSLEEAEQWLNGLSHAYGVHNLSVSSVWVPTTGKCTHTLTVEVG